MDEPPRDGIDEGLCLRRVDYGEHDAIVTFLTRDRGKLGALARGVKKPKSANAPACQMFVLSRLHLVPGKRLPILAQTEIVTSHYELREDLWTSAYATYLCELTDRALPEDEPVPEVYALLLQTLALLLEAEEPEAAVRSFELRLMAELGYQPVLDRCARCGERIDDETAMFCPAAGGLVHVDDADPREWSIEVDPRLVKALRRLLEPDRLGTDLARTHIPEPLAAPLREAVRGFLRCHLETEPKSAAFLDQLRRLESPDAGAD